MSTESAPTHTPIQSCRRCYPQRPMVIKAIKTSLRGKLERIVFECSVCGAIEQLLAEGITPLKNGE